MADLKLFKIINGKVSPKVPTDFKFEREIQKLCENNLEAFFGIHFIASEYSTGNKHKGRIDSLGLDENKCPVIIDINSIVRKTSLIKASFILIG